jgi:nucleotide-binding universal stress UspA family protein
MVVASKSGMHLVRQIVVGTNFTPDSRRAVAYAGELAKALDARLTVVHLDEKAAFVPGSDLAQAENASDRASMDAAVHELVERDVRARGVVRPGLPAPGLCDVAREAEADLVVVGTQGRGCLANVVLGRVTERVLRDAPCPVLVVRNP